MQMVNLGGAPVKHGKAFAKCRVSKEVWNLSTLPSFSDVSWNSDQERAGIGWILCDEHDHPIVKGASSINPTLSSLEAEAIVLRDAVYQMIRLGYKKATFKGRLLRHLINFSSYNVPREANVVADGLARDERLCSKNYVISWL
ncbi:hypothetical protein EUTSA_v10001198mg [Eutrema salsugineum]|uniref:RNase H type-1 domain-containing protein n=1 Tax=Eutrema salsugineum TaxID=72664 RepID=V4LB60_EUTSA|nr:hypothetical protein EUTSA_v10001198mg [Eutrema salsugineum]